MHFNLLRNITISTFGIYIMNCLKMQNFDQYFFIEEKILEI